MPVISRVSKSFNDVKSSRSIFATNRNALSAKKVVIKRSIISPIFRATYHQSSHRNLRSKKRSLYWVKARFSAWSYHQSRHDSPAELHITIDNGLESKLADNISPKKKDDWSEQKELGEPVRWVVTAIHCEFYENSMARVPCDGDNTCELKSKWND